MPAQRLEKGDTTLKAGHWCTFCPAMPACPIKQNALQTMPRQLPAVAIPSLGDWLDQAAEVEEYIRDLRAFAHNELEEGRPIQGWKLVPKRATRKWMNEAQAEAVFRAKRLRVKDIKKLVLKSPAQMEPVLKKVRKLDLLDDLVVKQSSGTTLAKADDDRPAAFEGREALKRLSDRLKVKETKRWI